MEETYNIDEILSAVDELSNIKKRKKILTMKKTRMKFPMQIYQKIH